MSSRVSAIAIVQYYFDGNPWSTRLYFQKTMDSGSYNFSGC